MVRQLYKRRASYAVLWRALRLGLSATCTTAEPSPDEQSNVPKINSSKQVFCFLNEFELKRKKSKYFLRICGLRQANKSLSSLSRFIRTMTMSIYRLLNPVQPVKKVHSILIRTHSLTWLILQTGRKSHCSQRIGSTGLHTSVCCKGTSRVRCVH